MMVSYWILPDGHIEKLGKSSPHQVGNDSHDLFLGKNLGLFGLTQKDANKVYARGSGWGKKLQGLAFQKGALRAILIKSMSPRDLDFIVIGLQKNLDLRKEKLIDLAIEFGVDTLSLITSDLFGEPEGKQVINILKNEDKQLKKAIDFLLEQV